MIKSGNKLLSGIPKLKSIEGESLFIIDGIERDDINFSDRYLALNGSNSLKNTLKITNATENGDIDALRIGEITQPNAYGFTLTYLGTGAGNNNKLILYSDAQLNGPKSKTIFEAWQDGKINFPEELQEKGNRVYSPNNKPSSVDIGALPLTAGSSNTLTGSLFLKGDFPAVMMARDTQTELIDGTQNFKYDIINYGSTTNVGALVIDTLDNTLSYKRRLMNLLGDGTAVHFLGNIYENGERVYSPNNKPTLASINAAPVMHSSTTTTYGGGSITDYGHLRVAGDSKQGTIPTTSAGNFADFAYREYLPYNTSIDLNDYYGTGELTIASITASAFTTILNKPIDMPSTNAIFIKNYQGYNTNFRMQELSCLGSDNIWRRHRINNVTWGSWELINIFIEVTPTESDWVY